MSIRVVFDPNEDRYAAWIGESEDSDGLWVALSEVPALISDLAALPISPDSRLGEDHE